MNYRTSEREGEVINEIKDRDILIFTPRDVKRFLGISKGNTYRILTNMVDKNLVRRLEKGKYILKEKWDETDIYEIATNLINTSYLGFCSALHFHQLVVQVPSNVFLATTKRKRPMKIQERNLRFVKVKREDFFGYRDYGGTVVSTPEKTIVDCLKLPQYSGGILQIYEVLNDDMDIERLVEYALRTESSSIASRLGYLLEKKDMLPYPDKLKRNITTYAKLDSNKGKKNPNKKWKLYVNRMIE